MLIYCESNVNKYVHKNAIEDESDEYITGTKKNNRHTRWTNNTKNLRKN